MSKFSKPKPGAKVTQADIDRVIESADADDNRKAPQTEDEVRFTMTLPGGLADQVDAARKKAGGMARLAWIRLAIAEKLTREGF